MRYCVDHRYFAVREIEIHGTKRLDPALVRSWVGMVEGRSIWRASPPALEAELESRPAIARARVQRFLPDRLRIRVRERAPRAVLHGPDGFALIDGHGVVIGPLAQPDGRLPIITVGSALSDKPQLVGPVWVPSQHQLRGAVALARLLEEGNAGVAVSEIAIRPDQGRAEIVGYSHDGRLEMRFGWGAWRRKLAAVRRVLEHVLGGPGPEGQAPSLAELAGSLDVRDPEVVVARWATEKGAA